MDWVAGFMWIRWQLSYGLSGNLPMDWVADIRGICKGCLVYSCLNECLKIWLPLSDSDVSCTCALDTNTLKVNFGRL
jgi:hypothetical protein